MRRTARTLSWATLAAALLALILATPRMADAYTAQRLAEHPCPAVMTTLDADAAWPTALVLTPQIDVWESVYPWLRHDYTLEVIDTYAPRREPLAVGTERLAARVAHETSVWWLTGADAPDLDLLAALLQSAEWQRVETVTAGACTLTRLVHSGAPVATVATAGGPIDLLGVEHVWADDATLHLVLYWRALSPVPVRYTVFTQLFDASGAMIAQQDNPPVNGTRPTDGWQPEEIVRDTYQLTLAAPHPGTLRLLVGMYTADGRQPITLADGSQHDALEIVIDPMAR